MGIIEVIYELADQEGNTIRLTKEQLKQLAIEIDCEVGGEV